MRGTGYALRRATVMRTRILSVTPINPLGVTAPLLKKGSQENGVNATTCRRYNPSVFSACKTSRKASSPYTGEPRFALSSPRGAQGSREVRSVHLGAQAFHFGAQAFWLAVLKFLLPVFLSTGQELHVHKGVNEGSLRGKFFRKNLAGSADFTEQTALRIGNEHGHSYLRGSEHF